MSNRVLRVLVVDDTVVYRKAVSDCLSKIPGVDVVGVASNGKLALDKLGHLKPDLLTLDQEMPELDGLGVLAALQRMADPPGVIMLSAFTSRGAEITVEALGRGAFDFALKPTAANPADGAAELLRELKPKVEAFQRVRGVSARVTSVAVAPGPAAAAAASSVVRSGGTRADLVCIGISTGGPPALGKLIPTLPADLRAPVVIVQHMPPIFTESLARDLDRHSAVRVVEAQHGMHVRPGTVYIAPGGKQLRLARTGLQTRCEVTDDPPENNCRPAVDYLFRSAAALFGKRVCGVIMTGMGNDGAVGCRLIKRRGGTIITQDAATCVVYGMPRQPAEEGLSDAVVPLAEIGAQLLKSIGHEAAACR